MKIKMLVNLGSRDYPDTPFCEDEEHEVSNALGNMFVARKLAIVLPSDPVVPMHDREPKPKQKPKAG